MVLRVVLSTAIVLAAMLPVAGQRSKSTSKRSTKIKPIRVTVVVKSDTPWPVQPKETDPWSGFVLEEDRLALLFPGTAKDLSTDVEGGVKTYALSTARAMYMLAVRDIGEFVDPREIDTYLDGRILAAFGQPTVKFVEKQEISYAGRSARHLVVIDKGKRMSTRIYVLNGKLFITLVSINTKDYSLEFEKWIVKFLNSFSVGVRSPKA